MPTKADELKGKLSKAMIALELYLQAGDKEDRRIASEKAKQVYREVYGKEYANKTEEIK